MLKFLHNSHKNSGLRNALLNPADGVYIKKSGRQQTGFFILNLHGIYFYMARIYIALEYSNAIFVR